MVSSGSRFLPFVALAAMLSAVPASAQNGRISGTVKDAHGGALSGATVRAANQATGASRRADQGVDAMQQQTPESLDLAAMVADLNNLLRLKTTVTGIKMFARVEEMEATCYLVYYPRL